MTAPTTTGGRTYKLGPVLPHVRRSAELIGNTFGIDSILGWRATARDMAGHPAGRAIDVMCSGATGDAVNSFAHANAAGLGITYTIWEQTYYPVGGDPEPMEDRGSPTQNHFDHVHIQHNLTGGDGSPVSSGIPKSGPMTVDGMSLAEEWANSAGEVLTNLGLKILAGGGALALLVIGLKTTVSNGSND